MKRIIALVLALACVMCLFAGCVEPSNPTGSSTTKPDSGDPSSSTTKPDDQPKPVGPITPVTGDKVYIYLPSENLVMGYNPDAAKPARLEGITGTLTDGVLTAEGAAPFEVVVDSEGRYTFVCGGKYLTSGEQGNSLSLEYDPSDYSLWTLETAENGYYISNVGAVYNGNHQYLEYYSGFTTYGFKEANAPIYTFQFFHTDAEMPTFDPKPTKPTMPADGSELTIEQISKLPIKDGSVTTERFYLTATIASVTKKWYGAMVLTDGTNTVSVWNSFNADGTVKYEDMTDKPVKGDTVKISFTVKNFGGTMELHDAWIQEFTHNQVDQSKYTEMTVEAARNAAVGTKILVSGVVAQITYANGNVPCGVILVDSTGSIYVYGNDLAQNVAIGNTVTLAASKTYWILESEQSNASKAGYKGCNQLEDPYIVSNDNGTTDYDKSWITESSVKDMVDTDPSIDISSKIFKVTALVHKADGQYLNYYFYDLDGKTGSYVYSQMNCGDFGWLEQYDGKICTVYLMALNAKSTAGACFWRFLPITVEELDFDFSTVNVAENALKFYATALKNNYKGLPSIELNTVATNELVGYSNVAISYSSSNEAVLSIVTEDGKTYLKGIGYGTATVTVSVTHNGVSASKEVTITLEEPPKVDYVNVATAVTTKPGTDDAPVFVTVKGIVGPSLVNQVGFYLIDESGVIAVKCDSSVFEGLEIGHEVILTGKRYVQTNGKTTHHGQTCIIDATIVVNNYGSHRYSTSSFITGKSIAEFYAFDPLVDYSTSVFVLKGTVNMPTGGNSQPSLQDAEGNFISLYCNGAAQYEFLRQFHGQEVTVEVAACNWNNKTYWRGCVLAVVLADGTRVMNPFNFDKY